MSLCFTFSINAQEAPYLTVHSPSSNSTFNNDALISFSASAYDDQDGDISHKIVWRSNIDKRIAKGANASVKLSLGEHTITVNVKDSTKNRTRVRFKLTVSAPQAINQAPAITIHSPSSGSIFDNDATTNFTGSAYDSEDGDLSYIMTWSSNIDGALGSGDNVSASLSSGNHMITAAVTDSEGLVQTQQISVTVNLPNNTAPTVVISSPTSQQNFISDNEISFTAIASDVEDGALNHAIQWHSNIDGHLGSGDYVSSLLSAGTHTVTASVVDSESLSNQSQVIVLVELAEVEPPVAETEATISWLAPTQNTDGSALTDLASFRVYYGASADNLTEFVNINDSSKTSYTFTELTANSTYYFSVTAINSSGTESDASNVTSKALY
jgi:hypothetical protein